MTGLFTIMERKSVSEMDSLALGFAWLSMAVSSVSEICCEKRNGRQSK